ncbi:MAG: TetR/AcrR family transcriptional regulator [Candidatus Nanopelagicales bacterium]
MNKRPYTMTVRAEAAEQTSQRILRAAAQTFWANPTVDISLETIAGQAGVTTRTVLRKFGSKEGLLKAAGAAEMQRTESQRRTPAGDIDQAVTVLVDHYEAMGDQVLGLLHAASTMPALKDIVEQGKALHWQWCRDVFGPYLQALPPDARQIRLAQFVAVCDVHMWQLLRQDADLSRAQTEHALVELLIPLTKEPT